MKNKRITKGNIWDSKQSYLNYLKGLKLTPKQKKAYEKWKKKNPKNLEDLPKTRINYWKD